MNDYAIGIDLGGTKIDGALIDREGNLLAHTRRSTAVEEGVPAVVGRIAACIEELAASGEGVAGVGIGAAGMTDSRRGVVIMASNLKWVNVPLRDLVVERLGAAWARRVWVDKDTNAAVLGEMLYGAGRGARHLLYVTVGTGVGGGMALDGRLYHGATEGASDIGHLVLEPDGDICGCGKRGCLEALSAGPAIARRARAALDEGQPSTLAGLNRQALSAVEVVAAAQQGDALARRAVEEAGRYLGIALAYYVDINNPQYIIVGGGVTAAAGELLLAPARAIIAARALPSNAAAVQVVPAGLGVESGAIGAAALVWHGLQGQGEA